MLPEKRPEEQPGCYSQSLSPWAAAASSHLVRNSNQFSSSLLRVKRPGGNAGSLKCTYLLDGGELSCSTTGSFVFPEERGLWQRKDPTNSNPQRCSVKRGL